MRRDYEQMKGAAFSKYEKARCDDVAESLANMEYIIYAFKNAEHLTKQEDSKFDTVFAVVVSTCFYYDDFQ